MRNMKILGLAALALGAFLVFGQPSFSAPAGKITRQHRAQKIQKVVKALNLTEAQKARIKPIREDAKRQVQAVRGDKSLSPAQKRESIRKIVKATRAKVMPILTPEQRTKLEKMRKHHELSGAKGARRAEFVKRLGLTEAQKTQLRAIREDAKRRATAVRDDKTLTPEQRKARFAQIRKDAREKMSHVLTPQQLEKVKQVRSHKGGKK